MLFIRRFPKAVFVNLLYHLYQNTQYIGFVTLTAPATGHRSTTQTVALDEFVNTELVQNVTTTNSLGMIQNLHFLYTLM